MEVGDIWGFNKCCHGNDGWCEVVGADWSINKRGVRGTRTGWTALRCQARALPLGQTLTPTPKVPRNSFNNRHNLHMKTSRGGSRVGNNWRLKHDFCTGLSISRSPLHTDTLDPPLTSMKAIWYDVSLFLLIDLCSYWLTSSTIIGDGK